MGNSAKKSAAEQMVSKRRRFHMVIGFCAFALLVGIGIITTSLFQTNSDAGVYFMSCGLAVTIPVLAAWTYDLVVRTRRAYEDSKTEHALEEDQGEGRVRND